VWPNVSASADVTGTGLRAIAFISNVPSTVIPNAPPPMLGIVMAADVRYGTYVSTAFDASTTMGFDDHVWFTQKTHYIYVQLQAAEGNISLLTSSDPDGSVTDTDAPQDFSYNGSKAISTLNTLTTAVGESTGIVKPGTLPSPPLYQYPIFPYIFGDNPVPGAIQKIDVGTKVPTSRRAGSCARPSPPIRPTRAPTPGGSPRTPCRTSRSTTLRAGASSSVVVRFYAQPWDPNQLVPAGNAFLIDEVELQPLPGFNSISSGGTTPNWAVASTTALDTTSLGNQYLQVLNTSAERQTSIEVTIDVVRAIEELIALMSGFPHREVFLDSLVAARAAFENGTPDLGVAALERFRTTVETVLQPMPFTARLVNLLLARWIECCPARVDGRLDAAHARRPRRGAGTAASCPGPSPWR